MKITPYHIIGVSSVLALLVLVLYFYQTSPENTEIKPEIQQVVVVEETPEPEVVEEALCLKLRQAQKPKWGSRLQECGLMAVL